MQVRRLNAVTRKVISDPQKVIYSKTSPRMPCIYIVALVIASSRAKERTISKDTESEVPIYFDAEAPRVASRPYICLAV